jgi:hypothetical protein
LYEGISRNLREFDVKMVPRDDYLEEEPEYRFLKSTKKTS